ncbi:HAD family hydrolase [Glacieibacterium frigidum]|uniref:Phosphoglycolate phosphatase n=1 Tax=Glacieibacterium frigidum TaxID=2593303 RepID=A0A552UIW1_9SPHN|nr:HAD family hydrolase [Glacieibacterium frigidum]TRW18166.1 HAD family hydrolase [Glacieibacterium frigidum]
MLPKLVIFDLDGTLVDTAPDLCAALSHALIALGREPVDAAVVRHLVGHGARALLEAGLGLTGGNDEALVEAGLPLFLSHYAAHIADGSRPYDGVEATMDELDAAGTRLAVCTNKPIALANALIEALGWSGRFAAVLGGDSLAVRKPDGAHVAATAEAAGASLTDAVFVGDTAVDVAAARDARVPVVVVAFGFAPDARVLGADAVIDDYAELVPLLRGLQR